MQDSQHQNVVALDAVKDQIGAEGKSADVVAIFGAQMSDLWVRADRIEGTLQPPSVRGALRSSPSPNGPEEQTTDVRRGVRGNGDGPITGRHRDAGRSPGGPSPRPL